MKIPVKGINKATKRLASGKRVTYWYDRLTGTRLPGEPGSAEFLAALQEARRVAPRDTGTLSQLIREYEDGIWFAKNDRTKEDRPESTKKEYKRLLRECEKKFGTMPIAALSAKGAFSKFISWQEEIGVAHPREADNRLTILSRAFAYAKYKQRIAVNPLDGFRRLYFVDRSDIIWEEDDIRLWMDGAPVELQRALILALHLGQRYGDMIRLRWKDYDGIFVSLRQGKTGAEVQVKVSAALKRMLDSTPKTCPYILARPDGAPWFTVKDDEALGKAWRKRMKAVGLYSLDYLTEKRNEPRMKGKRLHLHDVRGTSVTLLSAAGCTIQEVCSITGHDLESATRILKKYLARSRSLSEAAILKFENSPATDFANRLQTTKVA